MRIVFYLFTLFCAFGIAAAQESSTDSSQTTSTDTTTLSPKHWRSKEYVHFFTQPFDTAKARVAPMREIRTPEGYRYTDYTYGKGDSAAMGKRHFIRFIGAHLNGKPFSDFYTEKQLFSFVMGNNEVVPGLEYAMSGMREGGRRHIVLPSNLAFGKSGNVSAGILPDESVMFYVELVKVE